jgi:poly(A) polymerase
MQKNKIIDLLNKDPFPVIANTIDEMGLEAYLIGGYVRDFILKKNNSKDIDIVVLGSGIDLAKKLQKKLIGAKSVQVFKNYGTAMLEWQNLVLEFVGARKESYSIESRNPVVQIGSLSDDQNRRDFTINTLAISLNKFNYGQLIDPFNGIKDLNKKIIRTPLDPNKTYSDDPLRMFRAIRFSTQLDFNIEKKSFKSIELNKERINILSKERINEELNKILLSKKPSLGFINLEKAGLLEIILPELTNLKGIEEIEGQSHKDNFYHTLQVLDNISLKTNNLWLRWAALLHDVGKAPTKKFIPPSGWTFHGHEYKGSKMVYTIFKKLKLPLNEKMKYVQKLVLLSSRPIVIAEEFVTDAAVRRLIFDSKELINDLITLCEADITTKNIKLFNRYHDNFKLVRKKITDLEEKDNLKNFQPPITGEIIMKYFQLKPGKEIGIIKEAIKEAIIEGKIPNDYENALELMKKEGFKLGLNIDER